MQCTTFKKQCVCFTVSHIVLSLTPLWLWLHLVLMGEAVAEVAGQWMCVFGLQ